MSGSALPVDDDVVSSRSCQHGLVARHVRAVEERAAGWDPSGGPKNRVQSADQVPRAGRKDLYAICNILYIFIFFKQSYFLFYFIFFVRRSRHYFTTTSLL